jgi:plasmid replication initiation protein
MKNLTVVKSNRIIEASYKLTLIEQKTLLAAISQVDSRLPLNPLQGFEISVDDLIRLSELETKNEYRDLKRAAERLLTRIVTINNPLPAEKRVTQLKTHWISSVFYIPTEGKIRLYFSPHIAPYLSQLTREFTKYNLSDIGKMSSIYAIRLYELLIQWRDTGRREVELAWLKNLYELGDKYPSIKDFKTRVLDPAIKDINTNTGYQVSWEQRKTGRKVTHLTFTFYEKPPETEKPKRTNAKKEKTVYGVPMSEINKRALAGEKVEDAAARINRENEAKNTPPPPVKPSENATHKPKKEKPIKEADEQKAARFAALKNATKGK